LLALFAFGVGFSCGDSDAGKLVETTDDDDSFDIDDDSEGVGKGYIKPLMLPDVIVCGVTSKQLSALIIKLRVVVNVVAPTHIPLSATA